MTVSTRTDTGADTRIGALLAEHSLPLSHYLASFTNSSPHSVDDLLQETMLRIWRRLDDVPVDPEGARRWLFTVARNVGIDSVRRARARPVCVELTESVSSATDDTGETAVALNALRAAIGALSDTQRALLVDLHLEGRTVAEVAHRLRVPEGTVKSRAFYALQTVRRAVGAKAA